MVDVNCWPKFRRSHDALSSSLKLDWRRRTSDRVCELTLKLHAPPQGGPASAAGGNGGGAGPKIALLSSNKLCFGLKTSLYEAAAASPVGGGRGRRPGAPLLVDFGVQPVHVLIVRDGTCVFSVTSLKAWWALGGGPLGWRGWSHAVARRLRRLGQRAALSVSERLNPGVVGVGLVVLHVWERGSSSPPLLQLRMGRLDSERGTRIRLQVPLAQGQRSGT